MIEYVNYKLIEKLLAGVVTLLLVVIFSCDSTEPETLGSQHSFITMNMSASNSPLLNEPFTVTCDYNILYPTDTFLTTGNWITKGRFITENDTWEILSGDSSWIDTVITFEQARHSIVVRPLKRGSFFIRSYVFAPFDKLHVEEGLEDWAIILLDVK